MAAGAEPGSGVLIKRAADRFTYDNEWLRSRGTFPMAGNFDMAIRKPSATVGSPPRRRIIAAPINAELKKMMTV